MLCQSWELGMKLDLYPEYLQYDAPRDMYVYRFPILELECNGCGAITKTVICEYCGRDCTKTFFKK